MSGSDTAVQREFDEWMITKALGRYLEDKSEKPSRTQWLFGLKAQTAAGDKQELSKICGFEWQAGEVEGGPEETFKSNGDAGKIPADEFRKFLGTAADFRYWNADRNRQLIIEAKGTPKPIGNRDRDQARRYFEYLLKFPSTGGVVYFVPEPHNWAGWLSERAQESGIRMGEGIAWGVLNWKDEILPRIAQDLVRVVGETLIKSADLLRQALNLSKPNQTTP